MMLSDELYKKYVDVIYKKTGLFYEHNKKYYVEKRIEKRMADVGAEDYKEYYQIIKFSTDFREFENFINDLTVNETYFFRDYPQLLNFAEEVLPIIIKKKQKAKDYSLKIWSAACSTGEEAYTIAIILLEMLDKPQLWNIEILASDINEEVLRKAQRGVYESRAVKDVPEVYLKKYFVPRGEYYCINLAAKKNVKFSRINLSDANEMRDIVGFDFIFCRNALIYFDDESRKKVVERFYHSLNPGGFVLLGHSESIGRISSAYRIQKIGNTILYSKP